MDKTEIKNTLSKRLSEICKEGIILGSGTVHTLYDNWLSSSVASNAKEKICRGKVSSSDIIGVLDSSIGSNGKAGFAFTVDALFCSCFENIDSNFSIKYEDIDYVCYDDSDEDDILLKIYRKNSDSYYRINHPWFSKKKIKWFIDEAKELYDKVNGDEKSASVSSDYDDRCIKDIQSKTGIDKKRAVKYYEANGCDIERTLKDIENKINLGIIEIVGCQTSGIIYGNVSNASTLYGMDKFNTPRGHGFAAERANHLYDKMTGKDAKIVGDDNAKFGADRVVNGINIQSKYCNSGSKCIQECFENGKLKYLNSDGSPMKIEVPSDKYDAAVQAMENRIKNGQVPGVIDPNEAKNIVKKGQFTYEQAKNIAKFGTVESITFDAVNGAIIATNAFGLSTVLTLATCIWNGDDFNVALKSSIYSGLKVGGTTFVTAILSSQLSKAGLNSVLVGSSEAIVNIMGPKASAMLVNALRSGSNIYGAAAMKSAAKMLRGNAITGTVSVVVLSSVDVVNIFRGRISGAQLFKNVANTASAVAGGTAGWVGGAAAGAAVGSFVPIIGTAVGGVVGGLLGSFAGGSTASKASNAVLSEFIEDDADEMVYIIERVFTQMAEDYLLSSKEAENIIDNLKDDLTGSKLKDMFASSNRKEFARKLLINHVENEVRKRKKIIMPSREEMQKGLKDVLEEISDNLDLQ